MTSAPNDPILISRYSSRRLYNTAISDYVTLDEVAELIRTGRDVKVVDKKSGEDITRQILLQIITEHESRGENVLPLNVLNDIVRSYSEQAQDFVPEFLSQSFDALKGQQEKMLGSVKEQFGAAFDPTKAMENLQNFRDTQTEMLEGMFKSWNPFDAEPDQETPAENAAQDSTHESPHESNEDTKEGKPATREDAISMMQQQIAEMQKRLKDL